MEIEERNYFGVKCDLVLDDRRADKKGMRRVYVRLYHDRKYKKINTGLKTDSWKSVSDDEKRHCISVYDGIWKRVIALVGDNSFTLDAITDTKISETLNDCMADRVEELRKNNQWSTAAHYKCALDALNKKCGEVKISAICPKLIADLSDWLNAEGYSQTTIKIYLNDIKAVINSLLYKKMIKEDAYPFKRGPQDRDRVAIPKGNKRTDCWLDKGTIRKIWNTWRESHDQWIGLWLFSYLSGGMNLADVLDLRFDRHWMRTNGTELRYRRRKTAAKNDFDIIVPVTEPLKEIMNAAGVRDNERVFSYTDACKTEKERKKTVMLVNNRVSKAIAKACNEIGISDHVTTTWARHSFATVMSRERVPANFIEAIMGHANNGVSSHYIAGYSSEDMREFLSLLL